MIRLIQLFILLTIFTACKNSSNTIVETFNVKKGDFKIDLTETGELNATSSLNITSPAISWRFGMLKINQIVEDGAEVNKGDTVALFDPSEVFKAKIDAMARMEIAKAEFEKQKAEQSLRIEELESDLKINRINYQIAELQLKQATHESEVTRKEIQLNLDKTKINLDKAKIEIENQKKIHTEEAIQSQLKIKQLKANVNEADLTINKLTVVSPGNGIAIIGKNWSTGNKWQVGDQPWTGTQLILLPDLSKFKVETDINEVDIAKIKVGQKAEIRLDAFSEKIFTGKVTSVATLAKFKDENKSKIKVFPVGIILDEVSKELLPGMTVSTRIIIDVIPDVLYIPAEAIFKNGSNDYVWAKSGSQFKKKEIVTGLANTDYVIIEEGLKEDDIIALSPPEDEDKEAIQNN
jgi:HlyD family secretion protein